MELKNRMNDIDEILKARQEQYKYCRPVKWNHQLQLPVVCMLDEDGFPIADGPFIPVDPFFEQPENINDREWQECLTVYNEKMNKPF